MHAYLDEREDAERSELLAWNVVEEDVLYALFRVVADREPYVERLATVDSVLEHDVTAIDSRAFHVFVAEERNERFERFHAAFRHPNLLLVPPLIYLPGGDLRFDLVGEPAPLQAVLEHLPEGIDAAVEEVGEYDDGRGGPALTDRQREALRTAAAVGYYEVPREGSVADVAAELDCAPATASTHLRKAEARLVERCLRTVGRD